VGLVAAAGGDSAGVSQTLDGHGRQLRPLGWSFMGWLQACIASRNGDYGTLGIESFHVNSTNFLELSSMTTSEFDEIFKT